MRHLRWVAVAALLSCAAAWADPIAYSYDALGRLVKVERTGSSATVRSEYTYDTAGNRTRVVVTDQAPPPPPPPPPSFAINDVSGAEGSVLTFTVTRSSLDGNSYSVSYATAPNTALATSDYITKSGTLTFGPTDTSKIIAITTVDDATPETTETFFVNLSAPTGGATMADDQGVGNILDNDSGGGGGGGGCKLMQQVTNSSSNQQSPLVPPIC